MSEDDNDVGLPQKGLNMIIKDAVPDIRIANDTRDIINQCCVEFIHHISREAQRISSEDQRKTIYHEHVQKALSNLGFTSDFVEAADRVLDECKINAEKRLRRKNSRLDKCGIPEDELLKMQQKLIEEARQRTEQQAAAQAAANYGVPMPMTTSPTTPEVDAAQQFLGTSSHQDNDQEDYDA